MTEPIIHAALLGTANRELPLNGFPEILEKTFRHIQQEAEDAETALYRMSALAFAYHRAGSEPLHTEGGTCIAEAPEEVLPYFNSEVGELLAYLNQQRNRYLLLYAYRKAAGHNRLIPPSYLCPLIRQAYERNNPNKEEEQTLLSELTGRRGRWLLGHMQLPDWGGDGEEPWETAPHAERKRMLCNLRKTDARQGLALLQTELKNETAAHRNELIQCLSINLSKDDEPFLQEIMRSDRSGTVKETETEEEETQEAEEETAIQESFTGDPFDYLAEAAGYTDGESWWEMNIEQRKDNTEIFQAVKEAVTALRETLPKKTSRLDLLREAWMRKMLRTAQKERNPAQGEGRQRTAERAGKGQNRLYLDSVDLRPPFLTKRLWSRYLLAGMVSLPLASSGGRRHRLGQPGSPTVPRKRDGHIRSPCHRNGTSGPHDCRLTQHACPFAGRVQRSHHHRHGIW